MGSVGGPDQFGRFVGYGVPAWCDHPDCNEKIDRGLSYVCCNEQPYGGEQGCGLYFCGKHRNADKAVPDLDDEEIRRVACCERCARDEEPFTPKPEHPRWLRHLLTDGSWSRWRGENPAQVVALRESLKAQTGELAASQSTTVEADDEDGDYGPEVWEVEE